MTSRRWFALALGFASLLTISGASASAADWQPLEIGNIWEYQGEGGDHQIQSIVGNQTLHGRVTAAKAYAEGVDAGLRNFWLLDADGSVLLAGFLLSDGFGVIYEPPIRYLAVPPVVGPQPVQPVTAYVYATDAVYATFNIRIDALEDVVLALPAGSFQAFGVAEVVSAPGPALGPVRALSLDGRRLGPVTAGATASEATDWYSEGVGVVQYRGYSLLQLVSFNPPTPVAHSTWARVKRLYR